MYDLNIPWPNATYDPLSEDQVTNLRNIIVTLYHFKYLKLAINFEIDENLRLPVNEPTKINPIKVSNIINVDDYPGLQVYTRLTIVVNDSSKLINFNKFQNYFDLIAIKPTLEKSLQLSIINLNIDLISINLATKLNFYLKHKIVGQALKKGIKFEITYQGLISNTASLNRKFLISNLIQLVRATRSNGLIISGGVTTPLNVRSSNNIMNFLGTLGLKTKNINQFVKNSEFVLISGRLRVNSYKQIVAMDDDPDLIDNSKDSEENNSIANNYKKQIKRRPSDDEASNKKVKV